MQTKELYASPQNVKSVGRNIFKDNVLYMIHSASYIEFNYVCRKLSVDVSAYLGENSRIAVFINDNLTKDTIINVSENSKVLDMFDSETLRYGSVKIIKLSEARKSSMIQVNRIIIDNEGRIYPSDNKNVKIEFIGDSITCGYGVEESNPEAGFSVSSENALLAYPYLACKEVNADFQVVAYSGYGILTGFGKEEKVPEETLPQYYTHTAKLIDNTICSKWDFSKFVPDIIVINLGTNDFTYCSDEPKYEEFYNKYTEFIKTVRKLNPDAELLCTIGIMGDKLANTIQHAVYSYSYDYKDEKIHFSKFDSMTPEDGYAAQYHPSAITHKKSAKELVRVLRKYYDEIYKLS